MGRGAGGRVDRYWFLLAPFTLLLFGLYVVPLFRVLVLSVTDPHWGPDNFVRLAVNEGPRHVVLNTFRLCGMVTAITLFLAYMLAYVIAAAGPRRQRLMLTVVLLTLWVSVLVRAFSWLVVLRDNGIVNNLLISAGVTAEPWPFVRNELGVVIGMVHYLIPYAVLPLVSSMRGIDRRLLQASRSLGAGPIRTFLAVFLPLTRPGILAASVLVFVFSLGFYVTPAILGGGKVILLSEYVGVAVLQTARWGWAAAQAVVLLGVTFLALGIIARTVGLKAAVGR
ncbi:MAG TPA: ABC transporter permease [Stellaceae bacterium]|nr:ABC transporter permease [Stellaceae bacterium]